VYLEALEHRVAIMVWCFGDDDDQGLAYSRAIDRCSWIARGDTW
jgi:hypothetical protein